MPSIRCLRSGSWAMNAVTWVIANTNTRSKNSSRGVTRCSGIEAASLADDGYGARAAGEEEVLQERPAVQEVPGRAQAAGDRRPRGADREAHLLGGPRRPEEGGQGRARQASAL